MTRYMADSVDCHQFPSGPITVPGAGSQTISLTAGYVNGTYRASSQACGVTPVQIDVNGSAPTADVLDIETGDATPSTAPGWVIAHNSHGGFPAVLYVNRGNISAVANALAAQNLQVVRDYRWWISTLDGTTTVADMTGVAAVQAWGASFFPGHNIDVSAVYDDAWKPTTSRTDVMFVPLSVDMGRGRAYATFEVGSNSGYVTSAWLGVKALWGDVAGVTVTATDDNGVFTNLASGVTVPVNRRLWYAIPSGTSDVTAEWNPATPVSGAIFSGYVIGS